MKIKICTKCREEKPKSEFHKHAKTADGLRPRCKACRKIGDAAYYVANKGKSNARSKAYYEANPGKAKESTRAWCAANRGKRTEYIRNYRVQNPEKHSAHEEVAVAIKAGRLTRAPCMICGSEDHIHAHHDNYRRPLNVVWLCARHHKERHASLERTYEHG